MVITRLFVAFVVLTPETATEAEAAVAEATIESTTEISYGSALDIFDPLSWIGTLCSAGITGFGRV